MSDFSQSSFGHSSDGNDPNQTSQDWLELLFSKPDTVASPQVHIVPDGPLGNCRLANLKELRELQLAAHQDPDNYLQLFQAFAISHNPQVSILDIGSLPIPLGTDSPNLLFLGRSGAGKTQIGSLAAVIHALRLNWKLIYFNVKGLKQTRAVRRFATHFGRQGDIQTVAPTKLDRTVAWTGLEGGRSLSIAGEIAACMVASAARRSRDGEGAWAYNQAQEWLQHAIVAVCTDLPKNRRNLIEIRTVILSGEFQAFADAHPNYPVLRKFAHSLDGGNRNTDTISNSLSEATAFIDDVAAFLSRDELSIKTFVSESGSLIFEIDQADIKRLRPLITLFLGRLIAELQRLASHSATGAVPHKTIIIIDELIVANPPGLFEALHTCREQNYCFVAGAQSTSQILTIFGEEAVSILAGFQSQIAIAEGLDPCTAEHFSRRAGVATIALPIVQEARDSEGAEPSVNRSFQMVGRPILLPSDISNPKSHPQLGMPATILLGDGKTPPFQAYLTPAYEEGAIARMMDEAASQTHDTDLRPRLLKPASCVPLVKQDNPSRKKEENLMSDTHGWTDATILKVLEETKQKLDWSNTTGSARKWWTAFEQENTTRPALVLRLAEELATRKATITEFFLSYIYSNTDNIQGNLLYMDYSRIKKLEEQKKKQSNLLHVPATNGSGSVVVLDSFGKSKVNVVKAVKQITGLSLFDAKELVEQAPTVIKQYSNASDAERALQMLIEADGLAHIE